jgi:cell division protein FtsQ
VLKILQLIKGIRLLLGGVLLVLVIVLAEARQAGRTCQRIVIKIVGKGEQQFVEENDLLQQFTTNTTTPICATPLQALDIQKIHNFVRRGIVYKTWKGVLRITILPRRPIARIIYANHQGQYVDEDGTLLLLSDHYTARVLLVEVAQPLQGMKQNLREHVYGEALLALFNYIDRDAFWRAQIAYVRIDTKGGIFMRTQIGNQLVAFGFPETIEKKLAKLALFYKKIIPYKGWNTYRRVNIEFDNQIVCE